MLVNEKLLTSFIYQMKDWKGNYLLTIDFIVSEETFVQCFLLGRATI